MSRKRKKNGAELLLMGANGAAGMTVTEKKRATRERAGKIRGARLGNSSQPNRLNNPLMNANFTTAQKMELGRLGISWTAIQTPADVRKAKRALVDANKIRRRFGNPMAQTEQREAATEIYTGFHAQAPAKSIVLDEPHIPEGTYPELGLLVSIAFKPTNRAAVDHYERNFAVPQENVHVIGDLRRDQIYFAGGSQDVFPEQLKKLGWDGSSEQFEMGEARRIVYIARKYHSAVQENARGELVEWVHEFGEETGKKPRLWYDTALRRIYLRGGEYSIADEGIRN